MAHLEIPDDIEDLCLARDSGVSPHRPLFTGDVISATNVTVLGSGPQLVAILSHPCSMRAGVELAPHLHVAPVVAYQPASTQVWTTHFKVLPLGNVASIEHAAIKLDKMTLVEGCEVQVDRRVFCASRPGINLLRQRLVHHLTRVIVPTSKFDVEASGAHQEADLMEEWIEESVRRGAEPAEAAISFHSWITEVEGGQKRQAALLNPQSVPGIRKTMRVQIRERYHA